MFEFGWLNIGSLMLGLIAWILPVVNLLRDKKLEKKKWIRLSLISVSTCAISVCFQIFYIYYLVKIEDLSALMDTIGAMAFASAVLIIVTIILNAFTIILYRERTAK
jgi:cytochrome c oxidase subunit 4